MKRTLKAAHWIGGLCIGLIAATLASADSPKKGLGTASTSPISDVQLHVDGTLAGRVVDAEGTPIAGRGIALSSDAKGSKTATTDAEGFFLLRNVSAGAHVLSSGEHTQHLRIWTHDSAPPVAQRAAKLVCGPTVRGQFGSTIGGITMPSLHPAQYLNNPYSVGGVIGCAIAAPLIIHNPVPEVPATLVYSPSLSYLPQYNR